MTPLVEMFVGLLDGSISEDNCWINRCLL